MSLDLIIYGAISGRERPLYAKEPEIRSRERALFAKNVISMTENDVFLLEERSLNNELKKNIVESP